MRSWILPLPPLPGVSQSDYDRLVGACQVHPKTQASSARGENLLSEAFWVFLEPSSTQPKLVICSNLGDQFRLQLQLRGESQALAGQYTDERTIGFTLKKGFANVAIPETGAKGWYQYWVTEDPVQPSSIARERLATLSAMTEPQGRQGGPSPRSSWMPKTKLRYWGRIFLFAQEDAAFRDALTVYNKSLGSVTEREQQFLAGALAVLRSVSEQLETHEARFFRKSQLGGLPSSEDQQKAKELALAIRGELDGLSAKLNRLTEKDQIFLNHQYGSTFQLMHASIGTLLFEVQELARLLSGKFVLGGSEMARIQRLRVESKQAMTRLLAVYSKDLQ
jgi:hypothetical protein